jgi:hypothetical protein
MPPTPCGCSARNGPGQDQGGRGSQDEVVEPDLVELGRAPDAEELVGRLEGGQQRQDRPHVAQSRRVGGQLAVGIDPPLPVPGSG